MFDKVTRCKASSGRNSPKWPIKRLSGVDRSVITLWLGHESVELRISTLTRTLRSRKMPSRKTILVPFSREFCTHIFTCES